MNHFTKLSNSRCWRWIALIWVAAANAALSATPVDPPNTAQIEEARAIIEKMKERDRGPYLRIRWFCKDGTILPPQPYGCRERGGGIQHAQYSAERQHLVQLGFSVGTIIADLAWEEFFDAANRHRRMRELALETYLTEIDNGWVLRKAASYRGRIQAENEESYGRGLLLKLLADKDWVSRHYLLARETVRNIPHGSDSDSARRVRRAVQELAESYPSAERLRVEIHSAPNKQTATKVRNWADLPANTKARDAALVIADSLDELFGARHRRQRMSQLVQKINADALGRELIQRQPINQQMPAESISAVMVNIRALIEANVSATARLSAFDLLGELELEILAGGVDVTVDRSRSWALSQAGRLIDATYAVGLLSFGEWQSLLADQVTADQKQWSFESYTHFIRQLQRIPQWAVGSLRYSFAEPLAAYSALDSRAARFVDDVLRSSPLLQLASIDRLLSADIQRLSGVGINLFGDSPGAVIALNPGFASGTLRVVESLENVGALMRSDIVILPETTAELPPVAGILTLGEGNPLSHVQLLARNFGIPNVAIAPNSLDGLKPFDGKEVVLVVSANGSVALLEQAEAKAKLGSLLPTANARQTVERLRVPAPDLSVSRLLPLSELHKGLSGKVVGPKAANLGELNRLFPGKVAPAIAVPFGIFAQHTGIGDNNIRHQLETAYQLHRTGQLDESALDARLAEIRNQIANLEFQPSAALRSLMTGVFGSDTTQGVFLRSDTNVEDLPEFTGAGLSETVANVVGQEAQIQTIAKVWSSVLSPRAIAWRSNLLENPADVYASVLLMQSVPSEKSGVMITSNLVESGRPGLTVSTAWGVGGAVAGEPANTVLLLPDGIVQLVSEAKSAYQRQLNPAGGMRFTPAADGPVLEPDEQRQLRELAADVDRKYTPVRDTAGKPRPWDIEFGFVHGQLALFQIRPLVERGQARTEQLARRLFPIRPKLPDTIDLLLPLTGPAL